MTEEQILTKLRGILAELLGDDSIVLEMSTRRSDVPGWDSFMYVNFIVATEMEFGIRFSVADVESFETVGQVATQIRALLT